MRILAGAHKGRKLLSPPRGSEGRPITGLAKKSLFDILGGRLDQATVVDLYCATGTMGLEALSRGAARCCFAERDPRLLDRLRRNIETLGAAERCVIWRGDVASHLRGWLNELCEPVDVAFVDPPYAHSRRWDWQVAGDRIFTPLARRLADDGLVVLRVPSGLCPPERIGPLSTRRRRTHGGMTLVLLDRRAEGE